MLFIAINAAKFSLGSNATRVKQIQIKKFKIILLLDAFVF